MTNEEKIAELINIRDKYNYTLAPREVFDDAIKALEQQRNLTNEELYQSFIKLEAENERLHDALEAQEQAIKEAYEKGYEYGVKDWFDKHTKSQTCIEDYPTCTECEHYDKEKHYCPRFCQVIKDTLAEAQPSKDCRNCKKWNKCPCGKEGHENGTSIGCSIGECKDYEPCEDCVSREAVDKLSRDLVHVTRDKADFLCNFWEGLNALPSVTPQPKVGRWIHGTCQECKFDWSKVSLFASVPRYCPNCGSYNGGGEDEMGHD